jgi:Tol biopolymer transport system component
MTRRHFATAIAAMAALVTSLLGVVLTAPTAVATPPGHDGRIAFVRHDQIFTVSPSGGHVRQLTRVGHNTHPKWSPNGRRIAFVHETAAGSADLWVMRATGWGKRQVTHVGNVTEPTWSPDGRYLAFGGGDSASLQTIRSTAPFGSPTVLLGYETNSACCDDEQPSDAHPLSVDRFVAWSTDGTRIAVFNHDDAQLDDAIYMYNLATGEARQYLATGGSCCGSFDWVDLFWGPTDQFGFASTDRTEQVQPSTIVYPGYSGRPGDTGPAADPSGHNLAVTNWSSGHPRIYVQAINGAHRRLLTCGYQPDWQRVR